MAYGEDEAEVSRAAEELAAHFWRVRHEFEFVAPTTTLDTALNSISNRRATLGATANRLQSAQNTLAIAMESAQQANARVRDVDVAQESAKLSANQVLVQAGVSMLAQANQAPQAALKLLG